MTKPPASLFAIIVAAGDGTRLGLGQRKAHVELAGRPLVAWSIATFEQHPSFAGGAIVVHADDMAVAARDWVGAWSASAASWHVVAGGATRTASVQAGLSQGNDCDWIAVHDAARPLLAPRDLDRVVAAARSSSGGAILAQPVSDTIKRVGANKTIVETVDRRPLVGAQTPQVFPRAVLASAHSTAGDGIATDDAALVEAVGGEVAVVISEQPNPKLTNQLDLGFIEALLANRS
ncbi:MAG: 2-C-methyl-D-erythritol 4-phosphate cytidylyltransferase [Planctomycetota bacterium]